MALVTLAVTIALAPAVPAAEPPACPNGLCSGLGHAFYLPDLNVLQAKLQTSGRQVLKNTLVGTCATKTPSGSSSKDFQTYDSSSSALNSWSANISTGVAATYSGFNLSGTASANFDSSTLNTAKSSSVLLDYFLLDTVIDLNQNAECWSVNNLDPQFLTSFESLPINDPKMAAEASSWADYRNFLKSWGSHVQTKQELGSRLQILQSQKSTTLVDTQTMKAKVCATLGYSAINIPVCGDYNTTQKNEASTKDTLEKIYVAGGSPETRNALVAMKSGGYTSEDVNAFINSANNSDEPIGFKYKPIWELLMDVYRADCTNAGKDSKACLNFQRAVNLQATYEGFLAFNCIKNSTSGGMFVQGMTAGVANGNGIYYYACKQTKTGCRTDDDCNLATGDDSPNWFGGDWSECFCEGPSCVTSQLIPGTTQYRSVIKPLEPNKVKANSDVGVNASCRDDATCTCDTAWGGGLAERDLWDQATGTGGSGTFVGTQSVKAAALGDDNGDQDTGVNRDVFTLSVLIKDKPAYSKAEVKNQRKDAIVGRENPHVDGVIHVTSDDPGITIECGGKCTGKFAKNQLVTLVAQANSSSEKFAGWSANVCSNGPKGKRQTCVVRMTGDKTVEAYFR